jgi:hypothetical protein
MSCLNTILANQIREKIAYSDNKTRYLDGDQADGLYGLDLFLDFYQNNVNSGSNDDPETTEDFVRNPNCWAAGIDLTCCPPWNMHPTDRNADGTLLSSSNAYNGTLVSPRHILFCAHFDYWPKPGQVIRFVTNDNQVVTRNLISISVLGIDVTVGLLDSDVPESITFAKILPDDWREKLAVPGTADNEILPKVFGICINQDRAVFIRRWEQTPTSVSIYMPPDPEVAEFSRTIRSGDSGGPFFLIVDNQPVLLGVTNQPAGSAPVFLNRAEINAAMAALGGGYQLTAFNLPDPCSLATALEIRGVSVVQPQSGLDYPFVDPPDEVKYLIADFHLSVDDSANYYRGLQKFKPPFFLKCLYGIGATVNETPNNGYPHVHPVDIVICDSNNRNLFDTTHSSPETSVQPWGDNYVLYNWKNDGIFGGANCSLLVYSRTAVIDGNPRQHNKYITTHAMLDARAVHVLPERLLSIRVGDTGDKLYGKINFQNGYNTEISAGETTAADFVTNTAVTVSASAGSGAGKYPSCVDTVAPVSDFSLEYLEGEGIVRIIGYSGPGGDVVIPNPIDGSDVTGIGGLAFYNAEKLTSVTIPKTVTHIDAGAFGGQDLLKTVTFKGEPPVIGGGAFAGVAEDAEAIRARYLQGYGEDGDNFYGLIVAAPPAIIPIRKINGVSVDTGDFLLSASDCLYARRPTVKDGAAIFPAPFALDGHLGLGADCAPCCQCNDYVDLALKVNQYRSQYANIGVRVNDVKLFHEQNIQRWIEQRSCGIQHPLRLLLVAQQCPYIDVVAMVCNPCTDCLYSKELRLELEPAAGISAHAELVRGYTALFAANVNGRPIPVTRAVSGRKTIFTVQFPIIKASDSAYIRFRVKFSVKSEYAVTGVLTGTLTDDTPILTGCSSDEAGRVAATATATQALYCDVNGNTTSL